MFNTIHHQYSRYAGQTLEWLPADTEYLYQQNLIDKFDELNKYGWVDSKFTYKFNSHGFRCDEFTHDDSVMFLGCSITTGIGLPLESTWPYIVSNAIGLKSVNLAIGGTGPDTAFKLANHYIPQIKPKIVIWGGPPKTRFSLCKGNSEIINFQVAKQNDEKYLDFYNDWLSNEENLVLNKLKHQYAVQYLCLKHGIKFVCHEWLDSEVWETTSDLARDLMHRGVATHRLHAYVCLARLNSN